MIELVAAAGLLYLIASAPTHSRAREFVSPLINFTLNPFAQSPVLKRNILLERRLLAERSLAQHKHGANASLHAGNSDYAGAARFANNTTLALPGGTLYRTSGLDPHHIARAVNPYTHEVSR